MIQVVTTPIELDPLLAADPAGATGGVVLFLGTVRNQTAGRKVVRLEYETFEEMALNEMEAVAEAALRDFEIDSIDIVHRVGTLALGEVAVAIVVRAGHRKAAFAACQFAIDTLKQTVPIWKKEFFEDGSVWVGEGA